MADGNESRNNMELPCYMDVGSKLFPEAPDGGLDFTEPNRDSDFIKAEIREGQKKSFKPCRIWLFSHADGLSNNTGPSAGSASDMPGEPDFYGDGGAGKSFPSPPQSQASGNIYNEMPTKVYIGPFTIAAEYTPAQADHVLMDMGIERQYKDIFFVLKDDCLKLLGRQVEVGDIIERFDGLLMEVATSVDAEPVNWEYLYRACTASNTNKDSKQLFKE